MVNQSFLISGVSGVGKTTIAYEVIKRNSKIEKVITSTTRDIRPNEENGRDYYFYNKSEFEKMINNNMFFEHAEVYGNLYGSEKKEVDRIYNSGHIPLFVCDIQGIKNLSGVIDNLVTIFIIPDSIENLRKRIKHREGVISDKMEKRLNKVDEEMKMTNVCNYVVVNKQGELEETINELSNIIERELENKII